MTVTKSSTTNGMWKFRDSIEQNELIRVAEEWAQGPDGDQFGDLIVRRCSKDQIAIWFTYMREDGSRKSQERFCEKISDQLKRRFGNSFVGWDISSSMTVVK